MVGQRSNRASRRARHHEKLLMDYANAIIRASDLVEGGCSRSKAKSVLYELAVLERRMRRLGLPPRDVLERVEQYWYENDVQARAMWLLEVGHAMFPRRSWSFFFIGW